MYLDELKWCFISLFTCRKTSKYVKKRAQWDACNTVTKTIWFQTPILFFDKLIYFKIQNIYTLKVNL